MIAGRDVHAHQTVVRYAQQLFFLVTHELDNEQGDAELGQRLPCFDVVHLGLHQRQFLEVGVCFKYALDQLHTKNNFLVLIIILLMSQSKEVNSFL